MGRLLTLILGPIAILGIAFLATRPDIEQIAPAASRADLSESPRPARRPHPEAVDPLQTPLVAACQRAREEIMRRVGTQFVSIVHTPFVIVGDLDAARLERVYRET